MALEYMQSGVPQDVLDYYRGIEKYEMGPGSAFNMHLAGISPMDTSQFGGWYRDSFGSDGMFRLKEGYTDRTGAKWAPQYENGTGSGFIGLRTAAEHGLGAGRAEATDLYFDPAGNYTHSYYDDGTIGPLRGTLMVAGAALGMGAAFGGVGAAGAGAAEGAAGAGAAEGAAAGGVTGLGDAGMMYAGADAGAAASLGGGASINGGAALGAAGAGGTAAMGAGGGGYDLGGGLTMGADGSIGGTTYAGGGTMSNAGIESMMAGGGYGGAGSGGWTDYIKQAAGNMNLNDWAGLASTLYGAYAGSRGNEASSTSTREMDPRMQALFYGDLAPRTMGLLGAQQPMAAATGGAMVNKGMGLLGQTAPTTATNPYLKSIADDMQRRTGDLLGENNKQIQGNFVATGGLGGSRQGVAQGLAAGRAADNLQGNIAGLYGNAFETDQNRLRQDWTLGAGMVNQGMQLPWAPIQNTTQTYAPFTGFGSTTNTSQQGGGAMGALGGALGAAQWWQNMYGNNAGRTSSPTGSVWG